jgi:PAS domain S-box-containing protein
MNETEPLLEVGCGSADEHSAFDAGQRAARNALGAIRRHAISVVLVYAADHYDLALAVSGIREVVGDVPLAGAATSGEIHGAIHRRSIVVVILASPHLSVHGAIGRDVSSDWRAALDQALAAPMLASLADGESEVSRELLREGRRLFAMLLYPASAAQGGSEGPDLLARFNARCGNRIPAFGGASAGAEQVEVDQVVWAGEVHADSVLVLVFETQLDFGIALGHGFRPSRRGMTATEVDGDEIVTLDGSAAADVLVRHLGASRGELAARHVSLSSRQVLGTEEAPEQFAIHVASYLTPRGGVRITPPVVAGTHLTLLEPTRDRMVHTAADVTRTAMLRAGSGPIVLALLHYGALRPRFIGEGDVDLELAGAARIAGAAPLCGSLSYGEIGVADDGASRHGNASVAVLVLADRLTAAAKVAIENQRGRNVGAADAELRVLADVLDRADTAFAVIDRDTMVRYVNPRLTSLLGHLPSAVVGQPIDRLMPLTTALFGTLPLPEENSSSRADVDVRAADGRLLPVRLNLASLGNGLGPPTGYLIELADLGELRQAQHTLRQSKETLRAFTDNVPALVSYLDPETRFRFANQAYREWFAVDPERLIGRSLREVYGASVDTIIRPYVDAALAGRRVSYEREMLTRDGRRRYVEVSMAPHVVDGKVDGLFVLIQDLTPRRQIEQALRQSEERLRLALESGEMGTWDWNVGSGEHHWNERAYLLLGVEPGDTPGFERLLRQAHPEDRIMIERQTAAALAGTQGLDAEYRIVRPDGEVRWIANRARAQYDDQKRCVRVIGLLQDITAQREHRQAIVEAETSRRSNEAMSEFLSRISHELRTPLNAVLGFAQLLAVDSDQPLSSGQQLRLGHIERAGRHLLDMIEGVLSLSSIERGEITIRLEGVPLATVLEEALAMVEGEAARAQVAIVRDPPIAAQLTVNADRTRLRQCLVNVISNGIKFNAAGGSVTVSAHDHGAMIALSVADSGCGMDREQLAHLFEPFNRLGAERTRVAGTGIGMTITRRLIESMNGQIFVMSHPDDGSIFTLSLPRYEQAAPGAEPMPAAVDVPGKAAAG